jgi:hypothetical protein
MKYSNLLFALLLVSVPFIVSAFPARRAAPSGNISTWYPRPAPSLNQIFPSPVVDVLTFALTMEHIENTFYSDRLAKYSKEDFVKAGYPAYTRGRFTQIALHEKTHVQMLSSAISAAGGKVPQPCEYTL